METYASNAWAEIIAKSAVSPLGISALVLLIVGFVVICLVKPSDKVSVRLSVLGILLLFCGALVGVAFYGVEPTTLSPSAEKSAEGIGPVPAPPVVVSEAPPPKPPPPSLLPKPQVKQPPARIDCGAAWTGWLSLGAGVGNPCPKGCARGAELGQSYRAVDFPPKPQVKRKFQCWQE